MYSTLAALKTHLRITDTADDTALTLALTAASRAIDYECNRQFGSVTPAVARYYSADCLMVDGRPAVSIDDLQTVTSLVVALDMDDTGAYATTITSGTDFDLWPRNAAANGLPWTHLVMKDSSQYYLPWTSMGIRVTALWGWAAVPDVVTQAALIQASRFFVRRDSAYGVAGSPALGSEVRLLARLDPDVALLLTSVRRMWGAV
jgi:hypothetical protein